MMIKSDKMKVSPDMNYNIDSNMLTVITVFFYVLFVITSQGAAAIATILAAFSTLLWNVYKYIMDRKDRKKANIQNMNGSNGKKQIDHPINEQSNE